METLKASENGKHQIEKAIKKIAKCKGWTLNSPRWLEDASKVINPDWTKFPYPDGISEPSWKRFRFAREFISADTFKAFCQILELSWEEIAEVAPNIYGFIRPAEKRNVFNDYLGHRIVDELWADPVAIKHGGIADSYIKTILQSDESNSNSLKISFVRQGWGCNVTIRPMNDTPVDASEFNYLKFKIKSPKQEYVGVRVRITDAKNVCWAYGRNHLAYESRNLSTSSNFWSEDIKISLNTNYWFHFAYDGLIQIHYGTRPDFRIVNLIAFEVGFEPKVNESSYAKCGLTGFSTNKTEEGEINISQIMFE